MALLAICCACCARGIGEYKRDIPDGVAVSLQRVHVTAVFPGSVYVEESNRSAGIRVSTSEVLQEGDIVNIEGKIEQGPLPSLERYIDAYPGYPAKTGDRQLLKPLSLQVRALTGGDYGFQKGVPGNSDLNNVGLLVKVCGPVTSWDSSATAPGYFKMGAAGGETKVVIPSGTKIDMDAGQVAVTGICSVERVDGVVSRVLKVRQESDVVSYQSWSENRLKSMTLDEKIGQLFQVRVQGGYTMNAADYENIQNRHVGGIVYFAYNFSGDPAQPANLSNAFQTAAMNSSGIPLLVSLDQEGGRVTRIAGGCDFPGNMGIGASRSTNLAFDTGRVLGAEIRAIGGNMDLAPDLDVNNNPDNPVIGVRSFSERPELVSSLGIAYTNGLHASGVIATGKHFPGHGDTNVDSHSGLPIIPLSEYPDAESFTQLHCKPFKDCIDGGMDCVMTAHIIVECLDPTRPATLSPAVLTDYLRNTLGFDGVCMTDSMGMAGISSGYGPGPAAVMAIQAGNDLLSCLDPSIYQAAIPAVKASVLDGTIAESRIDQSVLRILRLKRRNGLFANPYVDASAAAGILGNSEHRAAELAAARGAINLIRNEGNILPMSLAPSDKVLLVVVQSTETTTDALSRFRSAILTKHSNVQGIAITANPNSTSRTSVRNAAADAYVTIVATSRADYVSGSTTNVGQVTLVNDLIGDGRRVVVVGTREPYEFASFPSVDAYIAAYNYRTCGFQAAADTIFGDWQPTGLLPVSIPGQFDFGWGLGF